MGSAWRTPSSNTAVYSKMLYVRVGLGARPSAFRASGQLNAEMVLPSAPPESFDAQVPSFQADHVEEPIGQNPLTLLVEHDMSKSNVLQIADEQQF